MKNLKVKKEDVTTNKQVTLIENALSEKGKNKLNKLNEKLNDKTKDENFNFNTFKDEVKKFL